MGFDFTKLADSFAHMDAARKRFDFGGLGDMSAALGAAAGIGAGMDRIGSFGAGADLAGAHGAGLGSLASDVLGTNLGDIAGAGIAEAKLAALDGGLSALAGPPGEGLLSATAGLAESSYWTEPSWIDPASGLLGASEKLASMAKPGVLTIRAANLRRPVEGTLRLLPQEA